MVVEVSKNELAFGGQFLMAGYLGLFFCGVM